MEETFNNKNTINMFIVKTAGRIKETTTGTSTLIIKINLSFKRLKKINLSSKLCMQPSSRSKGTCVRRRLHLIKAHCPTVV